MRPLGYSQGLGVDGEGVARHTGRRQAETDRAPGRDVDGGADAVGNDAVGQVRHRTHRAGRHIHDTQPGSTGFVDRIGDEAAVRGDGVVADVPARLGRHGAEVAALDPAQTQEIRSLVRGGPDRAVRRVLRVDIGDLGLGIRQRRHAAAGDVQLIDRRMVDRHPVQHQSPGAVGREVGDVPAAARNLGDQPVGRGIARINDIEVHVRAVATRRGVADPLAVRAPCAEPVAALAVRHPRQTSIGERIELIEFVTAVVLLDEQDIACRRRRAGHDRLGFKADLAASAVGCGDGVNLIRGAEPGLDQHRPISGVPAHEGGAAALQIGRGGGGQFVGHGRQAVSDDSRRLGNIGKGGRGAQGQAQRHHGNAGKHRKTPSHKGPSIMREGVAGSISRTMGAEPATGTRNQN
ncbi:hypothetical protein D3C86_1331500 [compost metagenome]